MASPKAPGPVVAILEEVTFIVSSIRSRGIKHYAKALGIGFAVMFASKKLVYESSTDKLGKIQGQLEAARATAQYADTYKELDQNLHAFAARLPPGQKTEIWLFDTVRDSMKAEGLVALSISPVQVTETKDFRFLTISITFSAKYGELASWIARVEGNKQLLHVMTLTTHKGKDIGTNDVSAVIASLVPRGGLP